MGCVFGIRGVGVQVESKFAQQKLQINDHTMTPTVASLENDGMRR